MLDVLVAHEAIILAAAFYGSVALVVFWEILRPRRALSQPLWKRWPNNAGLWFINNAMSQWLLVGIAFSVSQYAQQHGLGLLRSVSMPAPFELVIGILLLDFLSTIKHRLFHEVPLLWRLHLVHHTDLDCDVSTSLRLHPLDVFVDIILTVAIVVALGTSPETFLLYTILALALNPFRHGNIQIPARVEQYLRRFVVTPDYHRIHHSCIRQETNSNYGVLFPWWDWLMKTHCQEPAHGQQHMTLGLEYFRCEGESWLPRILTQPFRRQTPDKKPDAVAQQTLVSGIVK